MPALEWRAPKIPDFGNGKQHARDRRAGLEALKLPLALPNALETRLRKDERALWREALDELERYRILAKGTVSVATAPRPKMDACTSAGVVGPLPVSWVVLAQQLLQQRRNMLWRLGRLELAARSIALDLGAMGDAFGSDRSKHAQKALLDPIAAIRGQLQAYDTPETRPDGDWRVGALWPRFARHRPVLLLLARAREALEDWHARTLEDHRWAYTADTANPPLAAIAAWHVEHDELIEATGTYVEMVTALSQVIGRPRVNDPPELACVRLRVMGLARVAGLYERALRAQRELAFAGSRLKVLGSMLVSQKEPWIAEVRQDLERLATSIDETAAALMRYESSTLRTWDELEAVIWQQYFVEINEPAAKQAPTKVKDRAEWRASFFDARNAVGQPRRAAQAEPEQPTGRRGRRQKPFVTEVLDQARSPSRVAEVEQGLLAISELDAHLATMHRNISDACREGDCTGLPEAFVPDSPRTSHWVQQWRELPVEARTLGHNVIVLELTRLHLSRQVERLTNLHAWFSELSSGDLTWSALSDWEQTWRLYVGTAGTYVRFLRASRVLYIDVESFARPNEHRPRSERLEQLLTYRIALMELTPDYARLVDRGGNPPVPIETLLAAWDRVNKELVAIEDATLLRDEKLAGAKPPG